MILKFILIALPALIVGALSSWFALKYLLNERYKRTLREAERDADMIKQKKLLEVKEKFLSLKGELEKQVGQRNNKLQQLESKLKNREHQLSQRSEDLAKKNTRAGNPQRTTQQKDCSDGRTSARA